MIYTIACQRKWRNLASLFVKSLRVHGRYDGPIVIFTDGELPDRTYRLPRETAGEVIVRPLEPYLKYRFTDDFCPNNVFLAKISTGQSLLKESDWLAYFDLDTLAVRSVRGIFGRFEADKSPIRLSWDRGRDVPRCAIDSNAHRGFLTDEDRADRWIKEMCPVNAGHFMGTTAALEGMFGEWEEIALSGNHRGDSKPHLLEQSALNAWAARYKSPREKLKWCFFRMEQIQCGYDGEVMERTVLLHLFHYGLRHMGPLFFKEHLSGLQKRRAQAQDH